jgi:sirohydrochlorin cobaltochelatase
MNSKAIVLFLHGSKDPSWIEPFLKLRDKVAASAPGSRIDFACLQFGSPTLEETVARLAAEGIKKIVVVPVFISTRGHVAKDVPALVRKAKQKFPGTDITVSPAVGDFPAVQKAMIDGIAAIASQ